jgi:transcriptional regulator with XRE-family HTH domain
MGRPEKQITTDDARAELARKLRALRSAEKPSPTYQQLAARAHYSQPSLSQAASADARVPTWEVVRAYVEALDGDPTEFRDVWRKAREKQKNPAPTGNAKIDVN